LFSWYLEGVEKFASIDCRHVVNCVAPHPSLPLLATSGIDYDIKLWAPTAEASQFDAQAAEIVSR
jgi:nuclear receptor interaction protein